MPPTKKTESTKRIFPIPGQHDAKTRAARSPCSQEFENPKDVDWTYICRGESKSLQTAGKTYQTKHLNPLCDIWYLWTNQLPGYNMWFCKSDRCMLYFATCMVYFLALLPDPGFASSIKPQTQMKINGTIGESRAIQYLAATPSIKHWKLKVPGRGKKERFIVVNHQDSSCVAASSQCNVTTDAPQSQKIYLLKQTIYIVNLFYGIIYHMQFQLSSFDSCNPMLVLAVFRWPSRSMSEKLRPSMMGSSGSFTSQSARLRMRAPRSIPWDVESADNTAQSWQVCSKTGAFCFASTRNPPQGTHGVGTQAFCCNSPRGKKTQRTRNKPRCKESSDCACESNWCSGRGSIP